MHVKVLKNWKVWQKRDSCYIIRAICQKKVEKNIICTYYAIMYNLIVGTYFADAE